MIDEESLNNIERLHKLKAEGVITEADFEAAKQKLLSGQRTMKASAAAQQTELVENDWFGWATLPLKKYADFTGRSSRKEFWMFMLLYAVVFLVCGIFGAVDESGPLGKLAFIAIIVTLLGTVVPTFAVTARRFHDLGKSGWFALLWLVPYLGVLVFIPMMIEGTRGDNRFGPDPKQN